LLILSAADEPVIATCEELKIVPAKPCVLSFPAAQSAGRLDPVNS